MTVLLFSVIFLPWWITSCIAILCLWIFPNYYEAIIAGVFLDILYGSVRLSFIHGSHTFTIIAIILLALSIFLRDRVSWYTTALR
jgi:hypothetical protein